MIPDIIGRTNCAASVACGRLDINLFERCVLENLAVCQAVHGASACKRKVRISRLFMHVVQDMEEDLFVSLLKRGGDILVLLGKLIVFVPCRAKHLFKFLRENRAHLRFALVPSHRDPFRMMDKIIEIKLKQLARLYACRLLSYFDNFSNLVHELRFAIGSKPHHLVLVSIIHEAKVLSEGQIEEAK
ncbi:MAG: hypothetical protein DDT19_01935 [Syntrophomonadaceae bacterium]|nr:hypothetical protein [Bacillota bacterium]